MSMRVPTPSCPRRRRRRLEGTNVAPPATRASTNATLLMPPVPPTDSASPTERNKADRAARRTSRRCQKETVSPISAMPVSPPQHTSATRDHILTQVALGSGVKPLETGRAAEPQASAVDGVAGRGRTGDNPHPTDRVGVAALRWAEDRSEEHTSELQSLMRISY